MVIPRDFHLGALLLVLVASGCASVPRATQGGKLLALWGQISDRSFLRVRGIGAVSAVVQGQTARRGASRVAALVAARYQLLSVIKGVKLEGGVTIAQLMEKDSLIREIANEVVSGGDEVLTEWTADDGAVVTLELRRSKVERLIQEKSQREIGLEARIARDISEIEKLNKRITTLGAGRYNTEDVEKIKEKVLTLEGLMGDIDRISKMNPSSQSDMQELYRTISRLCSNNDGSPTGDCD